MHTNLNHDVFKKKSESIELSIDVEEFLKSQNKEVPDQYPIGYSALNDKRNQQGYDAQSTMRNIMFSGVAASLSNKRSLNPERAAELERLEFNRTKRTKAHNLGQKHFEGKCKHHGLATHVIKALGKKHECKKCSAVRSKKHSLKRAEGSCS